MKQYALHWIIGGGAAIVASAAARALPPPEPMGSRWYLFLYNFTQNILANFDKAQTPSK